METNLSHISLNASQLFQRKKIIFAMLDEVVMCEAISNFEARLALVAKSVATYKSRRT